MTTANYSSPFNFGDFQKCKECKLPAAFIEADHEAGVEIYRCPCGELEIEEPIIEN